MLNVTSEEYYVLKTDIVISDEYAIASCNLSPGEGGGIFLQFVLQNGIFGIYVYVCTSSFRICHLNLYQTHSITIAMATIYMDTGLQLCKWKDSNILAYIVRHIEYCNYSTLVLNTIILNLLVHFIHIYLVITFGCHTSLSIDFSTGATKWIPSYISHLQTYC